MNNAQLELNDFYTAIKPNEGFTHEYALINVREFPGLDGVAWHGTITYNNKKVGTVECDGNGGAYNYHFPDFVELRRFRNMVFIAYRGRNMVDVEEDCFINHLDASNLTK